MNHAVIDDDYGMGMNGLLSGVPEEYEGTGIYSLIGDLATEHEMTYGITPIGMSLGSPGSSNTQKRKGSEQDISELTQYTNTTVQNKMSKNAQLNSHPSKKSVNVKSGSNSNHGTSLGISQEVNQSNPF